MITCATACQVSMAPTAGRKKMPVRATPVKMTSRAHRPIAGASAAIARLGTRARRARLTLTSAHRGHALPDLSVWTAWMLTRARVFRDMKVSAAGEISTNVDRIRVRMAGGARIMSRATLALVCLDSMVPAAAQRSMRARVLLARTT